MEKPGGRRGNSEGALCLVHCGCHCRCMGGDRLAKLGNHLLAQQVQGAHHLVVCRTASPKHEQHEIDPQTLPTFKAVAYTVRIATDDETLGDQFLVAQTQQGLAIKAVRLQRRLVIAKVPAPGGASHVPPHAVVLRNAANGIGAYLMVDDTTHRGTMGSSWTRLEGDAALSGPLAPMVHDIDLIH